MIFFKIPHAKSHNQRVINIYLILSLLSPIYDYHRVTFLSHNHVRLDYGIYHKDQGPYLCSYEGVSLIWS